MAGYFYTHIIGCKHRWTNCAGQAKRYGCALLHGGASRLTADDSLSFARLPIGAPEEGLRGQDSSSPHKRMRGSALPALLVIYPPTPMPRAPMGVVVVDAVPSTCRGLPAAPHDG